MEVLKQKFPQPEGMSDDVYQSVLNNL